MQATNDISEIPFPVAYPLHWARDQEGILSAGDLRANAIFAAYQAMRLATLLMLADYLDRDDLPADPMLVDKIRGLRLPHWGEWTALADELTRYWSREPQNGHSRFPEVVKGWQRISRVKAKSTAKSPPDDAELFPLAQALATAAGLAKPRSANQAMQDYRNQRAHREGAVTPDSLNKQKLELESLKPLVEAIVGALFGHGKVQLLRACPGPDGLQVIRLSGAHPTLHFEAKSVDHDWEEALTKTQVAAIVGDEAIPIYPLLIPFENGDTSTDALLDPAAMIDGISDGKLTVMGVQNALIYTRPHQHLSASLAALARKHADLSLRRAQAMPWALAPWAQMTAELTLDAITGRKYFPDTYLERPDVDGALQRVAHAQGRALLLLGEAGSGKSSLIARLADQLTGHHASLARHNAAAAAIIAEGEQHTDVVAYLSGRADFSGDTGSSGDLLLVTAVCRKLGIRDGEFVSLADLVLCLAQHASADQAPNRRFWILLDGLNEADRYIDLQHAVDAFLPTLAQAPSVRLVVSLRSGAYHALARRDTVLGTHGATVFANCRYFLEFQDENDKAQPWLNVRPFRKASEGPAAYALRQAHPPAAPVPWAQLEAPLQELLLTPLYLHLFHQAWAGKADIPRQLNEADLLDAYLDSLTGANPETDMAIAGSKNWLQRLGDLMLQTRRPFLSLEVAESWVQDWLQANRLSSAQAVSKLDPIEELVSANVLLRPSEEGIGLDRNLVGYQFAQQKLAERIILRALDRRIYPEPRPSREAFAQFAAQADEDPPFWELAGALTTWVERLTMAGEGETLTQILDVISDGVRSYLLRAFVRAIGNAPADEAERCLAAMNLAVTDDEFLDRYICATKADIDFLSDIGAHESSKRMYTSIEILIKRFADSSEPADERYWKNRCISLGRLGELAESVGDTTVAAHWFDQGYFFTNNLTAIQPENLEIARFQALFLEKLGHLSLMRGDTDFAHKLITQSRSIIQQLLIAAPQNKDLREALIGNCNNLGDLAMIKMDYELASQLEEQAHAICEQLVEEYPDNTEMARSLSIACEKLGDVYAKNPSSREKAIQMYEQGFASCSRLIATFPTNLNFLAGQAIFCNRLGKLASNTNAKLTEEQWLNEELAIREQINKLFPDSFSFTHGLAMCYYKKSTLAQTAANYSEALKWGNMAHGLCAHLARIDPHNAKNSLTLSLICIQLGDVEILAGLTLKAQYWFDQAATICERLNSKSGAGDFRSQLMQCQVCASIGKLALIEMEPGVAREWFERGYAILDRLSQDDPNNLAFLELMVSWCNEVGNLANETSNEVANIWFKLGHNQAQHLCALDPNNNDYQESCVSFRKRLDSLQ